MNIVTIHFEKSLPVSNWLAIKDDAEEMARMMDTDTIRYEDGRYYTSKAVALHHSQVSERPFNFFVASSLLGETILGELEGRFIVNPVVEVLLGETIHKMEEGCVSFPHRKAIKKERAHVCGVTYQVPDTNGTLRTVKKQVAGLVAQMFQHETDHGQGVNLYYKTPKNN